MMILQQGSVITFNYFLFSCMIQFSCCELMVNDMNLDEELFYKKSSINYFE